MKLSEMFELKNEDVIAFDLDETLAIYTEFKGESHIGDPILPMVNLAKELISKKVEVVIFTARARNESAIPYIKEWCKKYIGKELEVTNIKSHKFKIMIDDKAIQVEKNSGKITSVNLLI